MLTLKDMKDIFPKYKAKKYKGIITEPGVFTLSRQLTNAYFIDIDLQEAMRETQRKYRVLNKWADDFQVHIKYEVIE